MEDGQEHQGGGEIGAVPAAMPFAEPPAEPVGEVAVEDSVHEVVTSDDLDDDSGLTGVLAALDEPDPADEPVEPNAEPEAVPEPVVEPEPETVAEPAPAPVTAVHEAPQIAGEPAFFPEDQRGVPIWPFLAYFAVWVIFAGLLVWQFMQTPAGVPLYDLALYGPSILAGLVLTAIGPLLAIGVWFMVWLTRPGARSGLFSRSLILGAVVTLVGVALWLIALGAVDMLRLGRLI